MDALDARQHPIHGLAHVRIEMDREHDHEVGKPGHQITERATNALEVMPPRLAPVRGDDEHPAAVERPFDGARRPSPAL